MDKVTHCFIPSYAPEILQSRSSSIYRLGNYVVSCPSNPDDPIRHSRFSSDSVGHPSWRNPRPVQNLTDVDVPQSCNSTLIQQRRLDWSPTTPKIQCQLLWCQVVGCRLWPYSFEKAMATLLGRGKAIHYPEPTMI